MAERARAGDIGDAMDGRVDAATVTAADAKAAGDVTRADSAMLIQALHYAAQGCHVLPLHTVDTDGRCS